ncbi:MAG: hypothetical protein M3Q34_02720 [bacterium]|nr:hypothetical protein [bacterium]
MKNLKQYLAISAIFCALFLISCNKIVEPPKENREVAEQVLNSGKSLPGGYYLDDLGVWDNKGPKGSIRFRWYSVFFNPSNLPAPSQLHVEETISECSLVRVVDGQKTFARLDKK